jgi:hypothetical protein
VDKSLSSLPSFDHILAWIGSVVAQWDGKMLQHLFASCNQDVIGRKWRAEPDARGIEDGETSEGVIEVSHLIISLIHVF